MIINIDIDKLKAHLQTKYKIEFYDGFIDEPEEEEPEEEPEEEHEPISPLDIL